MGAARRIVLTRTAEQCRPWRAALEAAGHEVLELPLLRFVGLPVPDPAPAADVILFTSPQGVRSFFDAGLRPGRARTGVLGDGTAAALAACGGADDLGLRAADGAELARRFLASYPEPCRVLLPGPAKRLTEPRASLEAAGFTVAELPLYRTEAVPPAELPDAPLRADDLIFFASPSAVRACAAAWGATAPCVAIGGTTAAAAREAGFDTLVADEPTLEAMVLAAGLDPIHHPEETS